MNLYVVAITFIVLAGAGAIAYFLLLKKEESVVRLQAVKNPKVFLNDKEISPVDSSQAILEYKMNKIKPEDKLKITADFSWIGAQPDGSVPGPEAGYCSIRGVVDGKELPLGNLTYVTDGNFIGYISSILPSLKANNIETKWMSNNFNAGWGTGPQGINVVYNGSELV